MYKLKFHGKEEADMELKDDDVIQKGDTVHFSDGDIQKADPYGWDGKTVKKRKEDTRNDQTFSWHITKVTRPGGKKMKEKKYPRRFFVQFTCPTNDDNMTLIASVDPQDTDFHIDHPMLEIKDGKVTLVNVEIQTKAVVTKVK